MKNLRTFAEFINESKVNEAAGLGMAAKAFKDKDLYMGGNLRDNLNSDLKKFGAELVKMFAVKNLDEIIQVDENSEEESNLGGNIFNMLSKKFSVGNDYKLAGNEVDYDKDLDVIRYDDMGFVAYFFTANSKF
jgi:hypothetical protein